MISELNAKHIEYFALHPVCTGKDFGGSGGALAIFELCLDAQPFIARKAIEGVDDLKLLFFFGRVDGSHVDQVVKVQLEFEELQDFNHGAGCCHKKVLAEVR